MRNIIDAAPFPARRPAPAALILAAWGAACWPAAARTAGPPRPEDGRAVASATRDCAGLPIEGERLGCLDRAGRNSPGYGAALRRLGVGCPANRDAAARLLCWDRIVSALPPPPGGGEGGAAAPAGAGRWEATAGREPVDGAPTAGVMLFAAAVSGSPATASLFVQCRSGATTVTFSPAHLIPDGDYPVSVQVGDGPVESETWSVTPNRMLLAAPAPRRFLEEAESADRALLRVPLPGEGAITATFDVRGLREAVAPVRRACSW